MVKSLIVATAVLAFGTLSLPVQAGQFSTKGEAVKPGQSLIQGDGCHGEYPAPQSAKPSA